MNLNNLSKEELIERLKKYMILCTNSFSIERLESGKRNKVSFTKGEYYFYNISEGGMCIIADSGEWFDVDDDRYMELFDKSFVSGKDCT